MTNRVACHVTIYSLFTVPCSLFPIHCSLKGKKPAGGRLLAARYAMRRYKKATLSSGLMLALPIFPVRSKYRFAVKQHAGGMLQANRYRGTKEPTLSSGLMLALPIFPASHPASIVGASELNFCVRDGNRWTLTAINTNCMSSSFLENINYYTTLFPFVK